jgi:hypothetical protein
MAPEGFNVVLYWLLLKSDLVFKQSYILFMNSMKSAVSSVVLLRHCSVSTSQH